MLLLLGETTSWSGMLLLAFFGVNVYRVHGSVDAYSWINLLYRLCVQLPDLGAKQLLHFISNFYIRNDPSSPALLATLRCCYCGPFVASYNTLPSPSRTVTSMRVFLPFPVVPRDTAHRPCIYPPHSVATKLHADTRPHRQKYMWNVQSFGAERLEGSIALGNMSALSW
jgi:hypothetical protein